MNQTAPLGEGDLYTMRTPSEARFYSMEHDAKIVVWRELCFLALGFSPLQARTMAIRRDVDREDVQRLVSRGATPKQVVGILV